MTTKPTLASIDATKVPEITLAFGSIKILATTFGETGGDAVSMSLGLGSLAITGIFAVLLYSFQSGTLSDLPTLHFELEFTIRSLSSAA